MDSEDFNDYSLYSFVDFSPFSLPEKLLFGNLRASTRFSILQTLENSPSSTVYKAQDLDNKDSIVALKHLKQGAASKTLSKEIFREITLLKSVDHENVIKLQEIVTGSALNSLYLVLEYCPLSLATFIDRYPGDIPGGQIKCIAGHLFKGLDYLHRNLIVHRDVKPTNLMISANGVLKIIDFGLGKRCLEKGNMTPNVITAYYQPPEIVFEAPSYGLEVDLWSAACCVAELFAKRPLLPGQSQIQQINMIIDLIGSPTPNIWPEFTSCKVYKNTGLKSQPFSKLADTMRDVNGSAAVDFLSGLFLYNPAERMPAEACLEHDWFERAPFPEKYIKVPIQVSGDMRPKMLAPAR